jgi:hypothetical protein
MAGAPLLADFLRPCWAAAATATLPGDGVHSKGYGAAAPTVRYVGGRIDVNLAAVMSFFQHGPHVAGGRINVSPQVKN